jgi:hypothetical protein
MIKTTSLGLVLISFLLTGCNLFGGLSNPSNDAQYLVAARACLDHGDYDCAFENYKKLSSAYSDTAIAETSLTTLAEQKIFSISDLIGSLGDNLGSAASFAILAEGMAKKSITSGTYRNTIKTIYDNNGAIVDSHLKAFSRFLNALAMFNEVLANAVGADGRLTASDLVSVPSCVQSAPLTCTAPAGTALTYDGADTTDFTSSAATWAGAATIQKLLAAATETSTQYVALGGHANDQGILNTINLIKALSGSEGTVRAGLVTVLSLE